jgi:hypothetical protein
MDIDLLLSRIGGCGGEGSVESVDKVENLPLFSTDPDARGCHETLIDHQIAHYMCARTLKAWGIPYPRHFLERWTTSEILDALDLMATLTLQGKRFHNGAGYLWRVLTGNNGGGHVHR